VLFCQQALLPIGLLHIVKKLLVSNLLGFATDQYSYVKGHEKLPKGSGEIVTKMDQM
jgi:hypothetical protein